MTTGTCLWGLKSPRIRSIKRDWHMKLCNFWAGFYRQNANKLEMYKRNDGEMCQFSWIFFIVLRGKVSVRPAWKMSLEPGLKLTATDGREAKVKRQWVPDNWSCDEEAPPSEPSCSGSWNEQITARSDERGPGRPELSATVQAVLRK